MADTPRVQPPGTGVTNVEPSTEGHRGGHPSTDANAPASRPDIRPVTLPDGTQIISGPVPDRASKGGAGNVAGTPGFGFTFHGQPGGAFRIEGAGFNQYGSVFVGGKQVTVTAWDQNRIKGLLPNDVDVNAEVEVIDGTGTSQKGPTNRNQNTERQNAGHLGVNQPPDAGAPGKK